jgi:hypothetical protein
MKKIGIWVLSVLLVASCGLIKEVPVETKYETVYNYIDTLIQRDSVIVIPKYVVKDVVPVYDTLLLETELAQSISFVDTTTHTLKGEMQNKKEQIIKYVYKDRIVYRDSIRTVEKEIPVTVQVEKKVVPKWCWWLLGLNIIFLLFIVYKIYMFAKNKFK